MSTQPIMCRSCNIEARAEVECTSIKNIVCPQCGASENYETFQKIVGAVMVEKVQNMLRDSFKGNKSITYRPGHISKPSSKFRLDL